MGSSRDYKSIDNRPRYVVKVGCCYLTDVYLDNTLGLCSGKSHYTLTDDVKIFRVYEESKKLADILKGQVIKVTYKEIHSTKLVLVEEKEGAAGTL